MEHLWRKPLVDQPPQPEFGRPSVSITALQSPSVAGSSAAARPARQPDLSKPAAALALGIATFVLLYTVAPPFVEESTDEQMQQGRVSLIRCAAMATAVSGVYYYLHVRTTLA